MHDSRRAKLEHLRSLSVVFDSKYEGPFGFRFGLDGLLGLIPFVGDFIAGSVSLYIIAHAAALGCSTATLLRMAMNVVIENIFDMIPLLGNFFDFFWKANNKNILLLEDHLRNPQRVTTQSKVVLTLVILVILSLLIFSGYLAIQVLMALYDWSKENLF